MVKLRLRRMGKKKRPYYRIVAADSRASRNGRFIEMVGTYDPIATPHKVDYKEERILHWLSNGAQPTDTVKSLLRGKGLWLKWTLIKQGADENKIAAELEAWEKVQEEKQKRLSDKKEQAAKEKQKQKEAEAKAAEEAAKAEAAPAEETAEPVEAAAESEEAAPAAEEAEEEKAENAESSTDAEEENKEKPA